MSRKKSLKYKLVVDGEWEPVFARDKVACCDCGLVHLMEYKKIKGCLWVRATRDNRATGQIRRGMNAERDRKKRLEERKLTFDEYLKGMLKKHV